MDDNGTFARALIYYLSINEMRQNELAKKLGVGTSTVNDWVHARKIPRISKVDMMCKIFGCRRSDFLEDKSDSESKLLESYRSLSSEGQERVREYIDMLIMTGQYGK